MQHRAPFITMSTLLILVSDDLSWEPGIRTSEVCRYSFYSWQWFVPGISEHSHCFYSQLWIYFFLYHLCGFHLIVTKSLAFPCEMNLKEKKKRKQGEWKNWHLVLITSKLRRDSPTVGQRFVSSAKIFLLFSQKKMISFARAWRKKTAIKICLAWIWRRGLGDEKSFRTWEEKNLPFFSLCLRNVHWKIALARPPHESSRQNE